MMSSVLKKADKLNLSLSLSHSGSVTSTRCVLISDLVMTTYSAVSLKCGKFSHKYSQKTPA